MTLIPQSLIPEFVEQAACAQVDPEIFFPGKADHRAPEREWARARAICAGCPVRLDCLAETLATEADSGLSARFGMYGALSPRQRYDLQAPTTVRATRKPAECGTPAGRRRHRALHEEPCRPCRDAWAAYQRQREAAKAAAAGRRIETRQDRAAKERAAGLAHLDAFERAVLAGETPHEATRHAGHRSLAGVAQLARRNGRKDLARLADRYRRIHAQEVS